LLTVDRYAQRTSRENIYAGGDFVTGASNVTTAMGKARTPPKKIDRYLMGSSRFDNILPSFQYDQSAPQPNACSRHQRALPSGGGPCQDFDEAVSALRPEEAREEASRCLRCDIRETAAHAAKRHKEQRPCLNRSQLEIDNKLWSRTEGQTIFEVAKANGAYIPSLCHMEG